MLWICVHFPQLSLELFARSARPLDACATSGETVPVPVVLIEQHRVAQRNDEAMRIGIGLGSTLATAQSLCHSLVHGERNPVEEQQRLRHLAEIAYRFSSTVSLKPPGSILLEVSGSLKLFGGLFRLKRRIKRLFAELGHKTTVGIAHTPAAATVFAHSLSEHGSGTGCTEADPSAEMLERRTLKALDNVEIRHTECDPTQIERLSNMGITRLGQLFRLPTIELGKRFGPDLTTYLAQLAGKRSDPRITIVPSPTFRTSLHLLESITDKETLSFPMQRLVTELVSWLESRALGVTRLRWRFSALSSLGKLYPLGKTLEVEFAEPQQSRKSLLTVSRLELDRQELPDDILTIELEVLSYASWQEHEGSLLSAATGFAVSRPDMAPGQLIDQLKARLGANACFGLETVDDHRPEHAWRQAAPRLVRAGSHPRPTVHTRTGRRKTSRKGREPTRSARPLWLLTAPRRIPRHQLRLLQGPERIDTGWWDTETTRTVNRHYYVARLASGTQCWVFTDPEHTDWYLHGYFG